MKKFFAVVAVSLMGVFSASAGEWDIFSLMFTEGIPAGSAQTPVCGFKIGAPFCGGSPVYGIEAALLWAASKEAYGIKCSVIATGGEKAGGLQLSLVNFIKAMSGLQLGIVNVAEDSGFQLGLVNIIKNSPVKFMPVINCRF